VVAYVKAMKAAPAMKNDCARATDAGRVAGGIEERSRALVKVAQPGDATKATWGRRARASHAACAAGGVQVCAGERGRDESVHKACGTHFPLLVSLDAGWSAVFVLAAPAEEMSASGRARG
jgi:hypothetical protein